MSDLGDVLSWRPVAEGHWSGLHAGCHPVYCKVSAQARSQAVQLRREFGRPERVVDEAAVLALLDPVARAELGSGRRVAVLRYSCREAAVGWAQVNRDLLGLRVVGPVDTVTGPVNVIDLGPAGAR